MTVNKTIFAILYYKHFLPSVARYDITKKEERQLAERAFSRLKKYDKTAYEKAKTEYQELVKQELDKPKAPLVEDIHA